MAIGFIAPQTIGSELLADLNELAKRPTVSELEVRRILRAATPLRQEDPGDYFMIEGICRSLLRDPDGVVDAFKRAEAVGGWTSVLASNYAVSLHEAGDGARAEGVIDRGVESFRDDLTYLDSARTGYMVIGRLRKVALLETLIGRLKQECDVSLLWRFLDLAEGAGVKVEAFDVALSAARDYVRSVGVTRPRFFYWVSKDPDPSSPVLAMGFVFNGAPQYLRNIEAGLGSAVDEAIATLEGEREPGDASALDWLSGFIQAGEPGHGTKLHAA